MKRKKWRENKTKIDENYETFKIERIRKYSLLNKEKMDTFPLHKIIHNQNKNLNQL